MDVLTVFVTDQGLSFVWGGTHLVKVVKGLDLEEQVDAFVLSPWADRPSRDEVLTAIDEYLRSR